MEASESPQFTISPTARRYALAGLAAVGALLLRKMLSPWFGTTNVYHTVGAAVLFSAWYCGVGPAIVATLISVVGSWYFILLPFIPSGLKTTETKLPDWLSLEYSPVSSSLLGKSIAGLKQRYA